MTLLTACGSGNEGGAAPVPADDFWIEPKTRIVIGIGQRIEVYPALQRGAESLPRYIDAAEVIWMSSQPSIAAIDGGVVTALSAGTATMTADHRSRSATLEVVVAGAMQSHTLFIPSQGLRRYAIYQPATLSPGPAPVVLALHGGGGSAMIQASTTQLNSRAHDAGFFVVYLEGTGLIQTFNAGACCGSARTTDIDDVAYVRAVLDDLLARISVDTTEVFATGFSNGGMMAYRLACALSDRIAGIAAIGGGTGEFDMDGNRYYPCTPARRIPVLHIHAMNDRNYPFGGGFGAGISDTNYYPIDATIANWVVRNNLSPKADIERVTRTTSCDHYRSHADPTQPSAPVVLCKVDPPDRYDEATGIVHGGGHSWPGGTRSPAEASDTPIEDFDASAYLWKFLSE